MAQPRAFLLSGRTRLWVLASALLGGSLLTAQGWAATADAPEGADSASESSSFDGAADVDFNPSFLQGTAGQTVDISRFSRGNPVLPGEVLVEFEVNNQWQGRFLVRFLARAANRDAEPCFDKALLTTIGLNFNALTPKARQTLAALGADGCADLPALLGGGSVRYDQSLLRLSITIAQAMIAREARGYVSPEFWDEGVNSATLTHSSNIFHSKSRSATTTSIYSGLTGGLNLAGWHFRDQLSISGTNGDWRVQNIAAQLFHDIPSLRAQLTLGDSFTDGALFNSFGFRGVSVVSDDRMRPESQQGYAPDIRGIARTNARVRITQNGNLLREIIVPPGAFEINDLFPTGYGGDLLVNILEADGTSQSFTVSYASVPQLLRAGVWRFSVTGGEYRAGHKSMGGEILQATLQRGISNIVTLYAGGQLAKGYRSGAMGAAFNTPIGAFSADAIFAAADIPLSNTQSGYSVRASYSKVVPGLHTNIALAAYRYSSRHFWSLENVMLMRQQDQDLNGSLIGGTPWQNQQRERARLQLNISQFFGPKLGTAYLTGFRTRYWGQSGTLTQLQAGYNNVTRLRGAWINYGLSVSRQRDDQSGQIDNRGMLNLSFAFSRKAFSPRVNATIAQTDKSGQSSQIALSGTLGDGRELNYNATLRQRGGDVSMGVGAGYRTPLATLAADGSIGAGFNQISASVSGGVVAHAGGITFANQMSDTIGLVEAKHARHARITAGIGARIDGNGYAVIPLLVPYRTNDVSLDPSGTAADVELLTTRQLIAPRANAVTLVKFETVTGRAVILTARLPENMPVPFGARIRNADGTDVGMAGQDGQIFLRSASGSGRLLAQWGPGKDDQCALDYDIEKFANSAATHPTDIAVGEALCSQEQADSLTAGWQREGRK